MRPTGLAPPDAEDALLGLIGDVQETVGVQEFRARLLAALARALSADWVSLNDVVAPPGRTVVLVEPPLPARWHRLFDRLAHENPLIARFQHTGDGRAYRFSDVVTVERLHALELYRAIYGPLGLEHQIAFTLPHAADRLLGVALSRRSFDFTDAERTLLDRARPFLIQAYNNAIDHTRLLEQVDHGARPAAAVAQHEGVATALRTGGLTPREAAVIAWISLGRSNRAVAETLGITERTVEKHLERSYRKLNTATRSEAAAAAWDLVGTRESRRPSRRAQRSVVPQSAQRPPTATEIAPYCGRMVPGQAGQATAACVRSPSQTLEIASSSVGPPPVPPSPPPSTGST